MIGWPVGALTTHNAVVQRDQEAKRELRIRGRYTCCVLNEDVRVLYAAGRSIRNGKVEARARAGDDLERKLVVFAA
jgi:hypothetical protein